MKCLNSATPDGNARKQTETAEKKTAAKKTTKKKATAEAGTESASETAKK